MDTLNGMFRYLPNTLTWSLLALGLLTGKQAWLLVPFGTIPLAAIVIVLQNFIGKPAAAPSLTLLQACTLLPTESCFYSQTPSLWMAIVWFYITYILTASYTVYHAKPANGVGPGSMAVSQRKSVLTISTLATVIIGLLFVLGRYGSGCEWWGGSLLAIALGTAFGMAWYKILQACGADIYPDIHGVAMGLQPGLRHLTPRVCA